MVKIVLTSEVNNQLEETERMALNENVIHYHRLELNTSNFFEWFWIKYNATYNDPQLHLLNTSYVYPEIESNFAGVGFALESIVGTILNLLVILALQRNSDFRKEYLTPSIVSIALTDLLHSVFTLPILSLHFFTKDMTVANCKIFNFFSYGLWFCSAWNLLGIAMLRCAALYFPKKIHGKRFKSISKLMPIMAWMIAFLYFVPVLFGKFGRFELECATISCRYMDMDSDGRPSQINLEALLGTCVMVMGILMILLNGATYLQVSRRLKEIIRTMEGVNLSTAKNMLEKEKRVGKMMAIISVLFFLVYCPSLILHNLNPEARITKPMATILCFLVNASIGIIDPLVYMICQKKYRDEIKAILESIIACKNPFYSVNPKRSYKAPSQNAQW